MKSTTLSLLHAAVLALSPAFLFANETDTNSIVLVDSLGDTIVYDLNYEKYYRDSLNNTFNFQESGQVSIGNDLATITIPSGFKYLNPEQSEYVMSELWGNPPSESLGMLFPINEFPADAEMTYAIEITYIEDGYVEDDDAKDLDYDDLLESMQEEIQDVNPERIAAGYEPITLVGWASSPFYDAETKKLHWAKELKFGDSEINTLNYDVRILGRRGYLSMNAIGAMDDLDLVKANIDPILASVNFNDGNAYGDFNPDIDEIAAYGIGGLITGKLLAKAGFFAVLLKFWKFIAIGAVAVFSAFRKNIMGLFGSNREEG